MKEPILEMRGITKKFGSVTANKDVDLTLYPGEIHALLGENGAGKSTLMNILNGIYKPNHGKIYYKGKKVSIRSPRHAVDMGIGMVHQHFRLIPTLTAAENVFLYMPDCKLILNKKEMEEQIGKWSSISFLLRKMVFGVSSECRPVCIDLAVVCRRAAES